MGHKGRDEANRRAERRATAGKVPLRACGAPIGAPHLTECAECAPMAAPVALAFEGAWSFKLYMTDEEARVLRNALAAYVTIGGDVAILERLKSRI